MSETYCPIISIPAVPDPDGIRFLPPKSPAFTVHNHVNLVWTVLGECNGRASLDAIRSAVRQKLPEASIEVITAVIEHLGRIGVLVDLREAWKPFHQLTCWPMRYGEQSWKLEEAYLTAPTALTRGQATVGHTHAFPAEGLRLEQLNAILAETRESAVTDGLPTGLRLLKFFVILVTDQAGLDRGYYEYDTARQRFVRIQNIDDQQLRYAFNSDSLLGGAQ